MDRNKESIFNIVKYGEYTAISCTKTVVQRLYNILYDINAEATEEFVEALKQTLNEKDIKGNKEFQLTRLGHVHTMIIGKELIEDLTEIFAEFLAHNRISPPIFAFIKQLSSVSASHNLSPYADEVNREER